MNAAGLQAYHTEGAQVVPLADGSGWRLGIPAGPAGAYRVAQLDDYHLHARRELPANAPYRLQLQARASAKDIPGTWGFGLWNDPFSFSLGFGGKRRLPALPNAAWFFFASAPNYLSLRDDLPSSGALAATFRSPKIPPLLLGLGLPALPLLAWKPTARLLRRLGRAFVQEAGTALTLDPTEWHHYTLTWERAAVVLHVDGEAVLETAVAPRGPLGLVIWIDNQYAALPPDGGLKWGTLENPVEAWIEIKDLWEGQRPFLSKLRSNLPEIA
jgi:hypothetical protein